MLLSLPLPPLDPPKYEQELGLDQELEALLLLGLQVLLVVLKPVKHNQTSVAFA